MHRVVAAIGGDGDNAMLKDIVSFLRRKVASPDYASAVEILRRL
jgi:hypothetical protein